MNYFSPRQNEHILESTTSSATIARRGTREQSAGVRAIREMRPGDRVFIYHSGARRAS